MKQQLNGLPIRYKYFLSLLVIVLLSFGIFAAINTYYLTSDSKKQMELSLTKTLEQTSELLTYNTSMIKYGSDIFVYQYAEEPYFTAPASSYRETPGLYTLHQAQLTKHLFSLQEIPNVDSIEMCLNGAFAREYPNDTIYEMADYEKRDWYHAIDVNKAFYTWSLGGLEENPSTCPYITLIRKIPNAQDLRSLNGVVAVNVKLSVLDSILEPAQISFDTSVYLMNEKEQVLSCCSSQKSNTALLTGLKEQFPLQLSSNSSFYGKLNGRKYLIGYSAIDQSDWHLIITVPYSRILSQSTKIYSSILVTLLLILPFVILISYLLSILISKPIQTLIAKMKQAETGDFNIPIAPYSKDEIGQLNRSFNVMLTKLSFLLDESYRLGKEKKNEQLKALQVQINPHFLYNTLDLINLMVINEDTQKIQTAIQELSKFYRLSLNSGSDETTLEDELAHIRHYVKIQNLRFEDTINLEIEVPPELLKCRMFKICLQPLVENAIYHGILEKDSEAGTIRIEAHRELSYLYLTIRDDGVGMDEATMHGLLEKPTDLHGGYGVYNVQERIKINYGSDCGISYESTPGDGTTATLKLKMDYRDDR